MYEQSLKYHCQRYSNNSKPLFSDEEILTIYFFVGHELLFHQEPVLSWTKASHGRISQERASSSSVPDSALSCLREWPEGLPERMHAGSFQQEDLRWQDIDYWEQERRDKANEFYAPVKSIKGAHEEEKQRSKAADDIYSQAVSSVREPIEALFSWLNEKTNIQRASKCRSTCGLLIHTMGKVAIAFLYLIFNYWFK